MAPGLEVNQGAAMQSAPPTTVEDTSALAHVLGIGTANPERMIQQADFPRDFVSTLNSNPRVTDLAIKISEFRNQNSFK